MNNTKMSNVAFDEIAPWTDMNHDRFLELIRNRPPTLNRRVVIISGHRSGLLQEFEQIMATEIANGKRVLEAKIPRKTD